MFQSNREKVVIIALNTDCVFITLFLSLSVWGPLTFMSSQLQLHNVWINPLFSWIMPNKNARPNISRPNNKVLRAFLVISLIIITFNLASSVVRSERSERASHNGVPENQRRGWWSRRGFGSREFEGQTSHRLVFFFLLLISISASLLIGASILVVASSNIALVGPGSNERTNWKRK